MTSNLEPPPPTAPAAAAPKRSRRSAMTLSALVGAIAGAILVRVMRARDAAAPQHTWPRAWFAGGFPPAVIATVGLWVALSLYWEFAARNASREASREPAVSRALHLLVITAGQAMLLLPIPGLRARFLPAGPVLVALGLALEVAAVAFTIQARRALGRHWSGAITTKVDHELIRTGPYAFVRHPIYTGMFGLCIGTCLVSGEVHALVGFAVVILAYIRKIRMEERNLATLFGPAWDDYCSTTKAVVPGVF